ncbi:DUF72 domain-containing protein, partial [Bordetella bronchiseptica]
METGELDDTVYLYRISSISSERPLRPGMNILIGTASWTDPTLLACGRFYPAAARTPQARLQYYATRFGMAEIDASFYALPDPHTAYLWAQRTPPGFVFNIKAFRLFTGHQTPRAALPADLRREVPGAGDAVFDDQVPGAVRDEDRKCVGGGKSVEVSVDVGGGGRVRVGVGGGGGGWGGGG